jgi:hypothetical protein
MPAGMITEQIHAKFKIFTGSPAADGTLGPLADKIEAFAKDSKIAAKSIGVEFLESTKALILSLGYRSDEASYPIKVTSVSLGNVKGLESDATVLEAAMAKAASSVSKIICHELYVTQTGEFFMVFMCHAG